MTVESYEWNENFSLNKKSSAEARGQSALRKVRASLNLRQFSFDDDADTGRGVGNEFGAARGTLFGLERTRTTGFSALPKKSAADPRVFEKSRKPSVKLLARQNHDNETAPLVFKDDDYVDFSTSQGKRRLRFNFRTSK
mmetsp:Transcript_10647/g.28424  ORF Transcript_10647/g.28424 Transcript_10647/m.28424 type:complete len:139 (-) Transcript_10647:110-526(-)|eukprot:CAMPEP_0185835166 /NCGR_PEP_ID=MMETSP1353-20130828/7192_1 /TAXON_ID=1077150 /ORGANISM="Erythrolobus australicus, Strain CCMP3124" /LENGTH=138 /DNA_ID=CAMNT_0028533745 /DNA_START=104 /DNA_END=520 /DNA_ORIENTATION=+